ncbi:VanZ family protein [Gynuella sp.]|uniref:VanZ family protein n=1 Tax=Gynuella sp. TaxID=2969146 RepID=UPI003D14C254
MSLHLRNLNLEKLWLRSARWLFAAAILVVTYLSLAPISQPAGSNDKVNHLIAYFGLALLIDAAFPKRSFWGIKVLSLATFGILIEVAQSFFPYRTFSLADWGADLIGLLLYYGCTPLLKKTFVLKARWTLTNN